MWKKALQVLLLAAILLLLLATKCVLTTQGSSGQLIYLLATN